MLFYSHKKPMQLHVINLNQKQQRIQKHLTLATATRTSLLQKLKSKKSTKKPYTKTTYVIDFVGDIRASAVDRLREEISAILSVAKAGDEVIVRLESAGGQVHSYGLASAQLARIKQAKIALTICVDKVAASGGYMMACVADTIVAAPFAIVGSIGVVSQVPNFYEFLKKHDIDIELFTAGEHKRTVTMFAPNSDEDRQKHQADLERIHTLFQQHVQQYRPKLDIAQVATGEIWFGLDARDLHLIDDLGTSDALIIQKMQESTVLSVQYTQKPTLFEKLGIAESGAQLTEYITTTLKTHLPSKLGEHIHLQ